MLKHQKKHNKIKQVRKDAQYTLLTDKEDEGKEGGRYPRKGEEGKEREADEKSKKTISKREAVTITPPLGRNTRILN